MFKVPKTLCNSVPFSLCLQQVNHFSLKVDVECLLLLSLLSCFIFISNENKEKIFISTIQSLLPSKHQHHLNLSLLATLKKLKEIKFKKKENNFEK